MKVGVTWDSLSLGLVLGDLSNAVEGGFHG